MQLPWWSLCARDTGRGRASTAVILDRRVSPLAAICRARLRGGQRRDLLLQKHDRLAQSVGIEGEAGAGRRVQFGE